MLLLDTRVWLDWLDATPTFPPRARGLIESALEVEGALVSTLSVWEASVWIDSGLRTPRILPDDALLRAQAIRGLRFVAPDARMARKAAEFRATSAGLWTATSREGPAQQRPALAFILAAAFCLNLPLLTFERIALHSQGVKFISLD